MERRFPVVLIAGSAGALLPMLEILASIPRDFPGAIVVTQHRTAAVPSALPTILARQAHLAVRNAVAGDRLEPGVVYVASPERHLRVTTDKLFEYADGRKIRGVLASANPLFESAAEVFGRDLIAVVLSGSGMDATDGVQTVKRCGGCVIAQDAATSRVFGMADSAIRTGAVDAVLPPGRIADMILRLAAAQAQN